MRNSRVAPNGPALPAPSTARTRQKYSPSAGAEASIADDAGGVTSPEAASAANPLETETCHWYEATPVPASVTAVHDNAGAAPGKSAPFAGETGAGAGGGVTSGSGATDIT